jgi:hypothetical protein
MRTRTNAVAEVVARTAVIRVHPLVVAGNVYTDCVEMTPLLAFRMINSIMPLMPGSRAATFTHPLNDTEAPGVTATSCWVYGPELGPWKRNAFVPVCTTVLWTSATLANHEGRSQPVSPFSKPPLLTLAPAPGPPGVGVCVGRAVGVRVGVFVDAGVLVGADVFVGAAVGVDVAPPLPGAVVSE